MLLLPRYSAILAATPTGIGRDDEFSDKAGNATAAAAAAAAAGGVGRRHRRCHLVISVEVSVTSSDQSLNLETRESYSLDVDAPAILIQANSVYGALRAMESLSQLVRRRPRAAVEQAAGAASEAVPGDAVWPGAQPALLSPSRFCCCCCGVCAEYSSALPRPELAPVLWPAAAPPGTPRLISDRRLQGGGRHCAASLFGGHL